MEDKKNAAPSQDSQIGISFLSLTRSLHHSITLLDPESDKKSTNVKIIHTQK